MRRSPVALVVAFLLMALVFPTAPAVAVAEGCTRTETGYTCLYGPITVGYGANEDFSGAIAPNEAGYITSARATLVDEYGDRIQHHLVHMHHVIWLNLTQQDTTCPMWPDRFFASGKERTKLELPPGHGYYWGNGTTSLGQWGMAWHLHGMHKDYEEQVYVKLNLDFTPASEATLTEVTPVWFDIDNCSDAEFDVPKTETGKYSASWSYTMPTGGSFVAVAGHLHDYGIKLKLRNATTKSTVFTSRAAYEDESDPWYLTGMTSFSGLPGVSVAAGDVMKLTAVYSAKKAHPDSMGIMLGALVKD